MTLKNFLDNWKIFEDFEDDHKWVERESNLVSVA